MSRETKLVKNTLILSIGTFLPKLASFVTLPILTACLSKEQYGTYDLITILVGLLLPVATMQIHTAAFRFLIEYRHDRDRARIYLSNILAFVIPVSLVCLTALYFVFPVQSVPLKLWTCVYLFFDTIVAEVRQVARGLTKNLEYSISATISAFVKMILAVILVKHMQMELLGAVIALALSPVLSLVYIGIKLRIFELIDFRCVRKKTLKEMLAYSWPMVPNNMSSWVMSVSDRFVVTGILGLQWQAVYAVANKIPQLLSLAQTTFAMAWQENASIAAKDEDIGSYYSKMFRVMTNFYAGCLGLLIACTPVLFKLFIRGSYGDAYPQMPVLFLAMFFTCMSAFLGGIYIACKETKSVGLTTFLAAVCNLLINLLLIRRIGLFAASGSTLVSYVFLFVFRMINVRKLIQINYDLKSFFTAILIIVLECVLCFFNTKALNIVNICFGSVAFILLNRRMLLDLWSGVRNKLKARS